MDDTAPLRRTTIERALADRLLGRHILWFENVDSTNTALQKVAAQGAADGTVAVAEYQTAGRGRLDRHWWAPPPFCLLFSVLFRPSFALPLGQAYQLTMVCSLAVCDAVGAVTGLAPFLKWPNDILLDGAKLGGILTETSVVGTALGYGIVGVGLNVNLHFDHATQPDSQGLSSLEGQATSLSLKLGRLVNRTALLRGILERADERYVRLCAGERFHAEWSRRLATLGQPVQVDTGDEQLLGVAEGVDENGTLLVRLKGGRLRRVLAGDVTQLRAGS